MPDWIPAWCFEASLSRQNGFSSLIFVPDMVSFESPDLQRNHKLQKSESGPRIGTKIGPRIGAKIGTRIGPKLGPQLGPKRGPELKDPFCPDFRSLFWNQFRVQFWDQIWAGSNGTSCFNSTLKITGNKGYCKGDDKADKTQLEIMQGQHQPSFQLLLGYQN